jgi:hypothetical protein
MADGFQVVMSDLQAAAETFHSEASTFLAIMPTPAPSAPDGGSAAFDESLNAVVEAIGLLHLQIGGDMDDNGSKLQTAHNNYSRTEESLTELAGQVSDPAKIR